MLIVLLSVVLSTYVLGALLLLLDFGSVKRFNVYLGMAFGAIALCALEAVLSETKPLVVPKAFVWCLNAAALLILPFVWFYVKALTRPGYRFGWGECIHLLPCAGYAVFKICFFWFRNGEAFSHLELFEDRAAFFTYTILYLSTAGQFVFYGIKSSISIRRYNRSLPLFRGSLEHLRADWVLKCLSGIAVMCLVWFAEEAHDSEQHHYGLSFVAVLLAYYILPHALSQAYAFESRTQSESVFFENLTNYAKSRQEDTRPPASDEPLSPDARTPDPRLEGLETALLVLLAEQKPYLDSELTLPKLAGMVDTTPNLLSEVINQRMGETFYGLINRHRVEEALKMLGNPDYDHLTIEGIGYEAGFNSKTTFNTAFRKQTGTTPSASKRRPTT